MIVKTRVTAQGTEFWDNEEKKSLFVPIGEQPYFEVTRKPVSMLPNLHEGEVIVPADNQVVDFKSMTVPKLKKYALDHNITIQADLTKKEDIIKLLTEELEKALDNM